MKKALVLITMLFMGISSVNAEDITLELCEYSDEYKAWLNLSIEEKNTIRNSISKLVSSETKIQKYLNNQKPKVMPVRKLSIFK